MFVFINIHEYANYTKENLHKWPWEEGPMSKLYLDAKFDVYDKQQL